MKKRHKATRGANNGHGGNRSGQVRKERAFLSGSLAKLAESLALYISVAGLIGLKAEEDQGVVFFCLCMHTPNRK